MQSGATRTLDTHATPTIARTALSADAVIWSAHRRHLFTRKIRRAGQVASDHGLNVLRMRVGASEQASEAGFLVTLKDAPNSGKANEDVATELKHLYRLN